MFTSFADIEAAALSCGENQTIALCGAQDTAALAAVARVREQGIADAVLIGDAAQTRAALAELDEDPAAYELVDEANEVKAARLAFRMVKEGSASVPMKGGMQTQSFMMGVLHPRFGVMPEGGFLSETMVFEHTEQGRLMLAADCALSVAPTLDEKVRIVENAVETARVLGMDEVRVAALSAVEKVNPSMPSSVEAAELAAREWPEGVLVEGPLALDNAVDAEAAAHKGISGSVAGSADVLLLPDLISGNIFYKTVHFFGHLPILSVLSGTTAPVVMTSRTDTVDTKYFSILYALLAASQR